MDEIAFQVLLATIKGERHAHYKRTVDHAKWCGQMITGKDQDDEVEKYRIHENDKLKKQRKRLYNPLTKYVLARPRQYFRKINKSPGINITIESGKKSNDKVATMKIGLESFSEKMNLLDWLVFKLEYLGSCDPNSWIIYERENKTSTDGRIVAVYVRPWVVPCFDVLNFQSSRGEKESIIVRECMLITLENGKKWLETFYLYGVGFVIKMREILDKNSALAGDESLYVVGGEKEEARYFALSTSDNGSKEVPFERSGAYSDDETNQQTYVSWFDPAQHVLRDLIRDKGILDVIKIIHAFRKRWEYIRPCGDRHEKYGECKSGYYGGVEDETHRCIACRGTGKALFNSDMQVNQLATPRAGTLLELSKLSFEEPVDTTLPEWFSKEVDKVEVRVLRAILNAGVIEMATGSGTATEQNYSYDALYDKLLDFERVIVLNFEKVVRIWAQYMEIDDIVVDLRFPKDHRMKPASELVSDYSTAKAAGLPYDILRVMVENIIYKMNEDNPTEVGRILARLDWMPFADKTTEEVVMILASRSPLDPERLLYENALTIFNDIEAENESPEFWEMTYEKQKKVIRAKVDQYSKKILIDGEEQQQQEEEEPAIPGSDNEPE